VSTSRRLWVGLTAAVILAFATFWRRSTWLRDHPLTADAATHLIPVAARVDACVRQHGLLPSAGNAPQLKSCVCAELLANARAYCYVGDGFVAFTSDALPPGVFRVRGDPAAPTQGMAYVPVGAVGPTAQEFDRNFGSFGPSSGPRAPGWYRVGFCPSCD
jgi:hypothetical protein